jgi:GntR family transcriptional regulator
MLIVVDPHSGVPVYRQIMAQVKFHIASGLLAAGDELPSTRSLSVELGVNPMTVSKAYSYQEKEEVVERRPGRPVVVRKLEGTEMRNRKLDRLRASLSPTVIMVRQLDIPSGDAVDIFRELLDDNELSDTEER